jgi:4-carboxymuconolactone decarboxylase
MSKFSGSRYRLLRPTPVLAGKAMKPGNLIGASSLSVAMLFSVSAQDRMPLIPLEKMTDLQKKHAEEIIKGPRGALYGPFIPLIRSPELMDRAQRMGEYLRYHSAIGNKLSELVILIVSRRWTQQFEWDTHEPIALKVGISPETVKAIREGRKPAQLSDDEQIVYDVTTELDATKDLSDATYKRAVERFGEPGVIDMVGIQGYYTFLAMIMNAARTKVVDPKTTPLEPLER